MVYIFLDAQTEPAERGTPSAHLPAIFSQCSGIVSSIISLHLSGHNDQHTKQIIKAYTLSLDGSRTLLSYRQSFTAR